MRLQQLLREIDAQRAVVDSRLRRPAPWRGLLRRDLWGHAAQGDSARSAAAFNWLRTHTAEPGTLDVSFVTALHDRAVGGKELRSVPLRVGEQRHYPAPDRVRPLLEQALADARSSRLEPPARAALLHLDLVAIHPFRDGNGRTARLLASWLLLRAGYRSTLFTAVDQHHEAAPREYVDVLNRYHDDKLSKELCLLFLLGAMAARSSAVAWFRARSNRLRLLCPKLGVPSWQLEDELIRFDRGDRSILSSSVAAGQPWSLLSQGWNAEALVRLREQLERLRLEESEQGT